MIVENLTQILNKYVGIERKDECIQNLFPPKSDMGMNSVWSLVFQKWSIVLNDIKIYPQILGFIPNLELLPVQL